MNKYIFSKDQLQSYGQNGFLVCKNVFRPEEVLDLVKWSREVENFKETTEKWMLYFDPSLKDENKMILTRIENFVTFHQGLNKLLNSENFLNIVSQLFKEEAILFKDKYHLKHPGAKGFKPHQDATIWKDMYGISSFITIFIAIDESNLTNGCLEFSEGQHLKGLLSKPWKEIDKSTENKLNWKPIISKPGDIVIFGDHTPHKSKDNFSDKSRRSFFFTFNKLSEGDHRIRHFRDKRKNYPPNFERDMGKKYTFHV